MTSEQLDTNDGEYEVKTHLTEIGQFPLLTRDDEVSLAQAIEAGAKAREEFEIVASNRSTLTDIEAERLTQAITAGGEAQRSFVQANLRLVVSIAKKCQDSGSDLLDLVQAGNVGLMRAVDNYDWRTDLKFPTHATPLIRQAIYDSLPER